jgi:hypothetical protein
MPLILPGNVASATAATTYDVDNSIRLHKTGVSAGAKLHWTPGSAGNQKTMTWSFWIKRGRLDDVYNTLYNSSGGNSTIDFQSSTQGLNQLRGSFNDSGGVTVFVTNAIYRDPTAWMHIVVAIDTTQGVDTNRVKLYINGVQLTDANGDFETWANLPAEDEDILANDANKFNLFSNSAADSSYEGYAAETIFIDGTAYAASDFGEFDSDSPNIWKPKDPSGLTFGSNGFWLDYEDSSNLGNDVSGNGNDLTEVDIDAVDQCQDSPTNNFATLNPLQNYYDPGAFAQGNCTYTTEGSTGMYSFRTTTLGMSKSKWYMEFHKTAGDGNGQWGYASEFPTANNNWLGEVVGNYGLYGANGYLYTNASSVSTGWGTMSTGYVMLAIDLDNNFIYFGKDGTWLKSGDPTSGATGTGGQSITAASASTIGQYFFAVGDFDNGSGHAYQCNFGNGSFGDTAAGATQADDNDQGIFKYDVPTGYYALCTKNLAEFG